MGVNRLERKDRRGGGYSRRKFTSEEANKIRDAYLKGEISQSGLATTYGTSHPLIHQLISGKTYKD